MTVLRYYTIMAVNNNGLNVQANLHLCCLYMDRSTTKPANVLCAQRRLRSAWASAQSDHSLRCALIVQVSTRDFFMQQRRPGGCPG